MYVSHTISKLLQIIGQAASAVAEIWKGSRNSLKWSREPLATSFDLILHLSIEPPVFNLSFKFDANIFIGDRYMAILRLHGFGCEMPIQANWGILIP